jgi:hypothetical protein
MLQMKSQILSNIRDSAAGAVILVYRHATVWVLLTFALGYLVQEVISRRRREKFRRRHLK